MLARLCQNRDAPAPPTHAGVIHSARGVVPANRGLPSSRAMLTPLEMLMSIGETVWVEFGQILRCLSDDFPILFPGSPSVLAMPFLSRAHLNISRAFPCDILPSGCLPPPFSFLSEIRADRSVPLSDRERKTQNPYGPICGLAFCIS